MAPDGVSIAVQEWGREDGPEVLFVHGGMNSHLCWERQVVDERLAGMRLVTYDLRGHGDSDKPRERAPYEDGDRWADELDAVMEASALRRPVVIAWSLGGVIMSAYLRKYGTARLAGALWVGAIPAVPKDMASAVFELMPRLLSPHFGERIDGLRAWLHSCFGTGTVAPDVFERLLASTAVALPMLPITAPPMLDDPWPALRAFDRPALIVQGGMDRITLPDMGRRLAENIPNATLSLYEGAGHMPFLEEPDRFARDVVALVERSR
jgi:non-heme chloroperoxidase